MSNQNQKTENFVYDSLSNVKIEKYNDNYTFHHLIGQTLLYCGYPYRTTSVTNLKVGDYYKVEGISTDRFGLDHKLLLVDVKTGIKFEDEAFSYHYQNFKWVVVGYYEKVKSTYLNKDYIYIDEGHNNDYVKVKNLIHLEKDTPTHDIAKNSIWTCVDIQVKPRTEKDGLNSDKRSPVVLIFDNAQYGKHYCYLEDKRGYPHNSIKSDLSTIKVCDKFQLKSNYDSIKASSMESKKNRKEYLVKKYGASMANIIFEGKINIGMNKEMCRDSWGKPDKINSTTTEYGTSEQWVYGYSYVYFDENGLITTIQN